MQTGLMLVTFLLVAGGVWLLFSGRSYRRDLPGRRGDLSLLKKFQQATKDVDINKMQKIIRDNGTEWLTPQAKAQALHLAVLLEKEDLARMMLEAGADTEFLVDGSTALETACVSVQEDNPSSLTETQRQTAFAMIDLLLQYGADVNGKDFVPMFIAVQSGDIPLARKLLEAGADVNKVSEGDITVLEHAKFCKQHEMVQWLQEHGAK